MVTGRSLTKRLRRRLEAWGVRIDVPSARVALAIREVGIGFLFAPAAHAATRHAMPARQALAVEPFFICWAH